MKIDLSRKAAAFVVSMTLFCSLAFADDALRLIVPAVSGLRTTEVKQDPQPEAHFSGQVWVAGTFRAQWYKGLNQKSYSLSTDIKLDKSEIDRLPHFGDDRAASVNIENATDAVQIVFDKELTARILSQKAQLTEVHGHFLVEDVAIGECGSPWASSSLVKAKRFGAVKVSSGLVMGDC